MNLPLEKEAILPRLDGIRKNIAKLRSLGELPIEKFETGDAFDLAQHHLRLALEGVFHLGSHILSRIPGGRAVEYSGIALKLGELGIVDKKFANEKLVPMAKLRNLLVHQYADINPVRIYGITHDYLGDIELFLKAVGEVVEHPEKWNLTIE
ncbi:MAG: HepT-like ribonuclease domain-containing protein [Patescibacteria group bacterium]|jgi:uncharacterized protein YutE (UPF0331/DUF86 family)